MTGSLDVLRTAGQAFVEKDSMRHALAHACMSVVHHGVSVNVLCGNFIDAAAVENGDQHAQTGL